MAHALAIALVESRVESRLSRTARVKRECKIFRRFNVRFYLLYRPCSRQKSIGPAHQAIGVTDYPLDWILFLREPDHREQLRKRDVPDGTKVALPSAASRGRGRSGKDWQFFRHLRTDDLRSTSSSRNSRFEK